MVKAKVEGRERLARKLRRIPVVMENRINGARHKGADEMIALAGSLIDDKSGKLRRSLRKKVQETTTDDTKAGAVWVTAGDDEAFYASWVEFGTRQHWQPRWRGGTMHPGATAKPFFFPAYRLLKKRIISRIKREATRGAKEAARGG